MNEHYPFINFPLPYAYDALEPFIDAKTMMLHHDRHLQTYIDNLNNALKDYPEYQTLTLEELILGVNRLPIPLQEPVNNNAGGVYNHQFYFANLHRSNAEHPVGALAVNINRVFGSFFTFQEQFKKAALSVFGSGYTWLVTDGGGRLVIMTTANQNTLLSKHLYPILNVDVWEHAYYLKHYNVRADYVDDWFQVVNWDMVSRRYIHCLSGYNE